MPGQMHFTIDDELHGRRLDSALAALDRGDSREVLQSAVAQGLVRVDGEVVAKASFRVAAGQEIALSVPEREPGSVLPEDLPLDIVYQDEDILVINKPAGVVVHPGAGVSCGTLMNALLFHFPAAARLARAGIVHRLDKDTSGLMVTALSGAAQRKLVRAISRHEVVREYEAVVWGLISSGGTVEAAVGRDPRNRLRMAVVPDGLGREAVTHYRVKERFRAHTLLRLRLQTGRTHQIRVHMASIDHPLLGDPVYGGRRFRTLKDAGGELNQALRAFARQALHAAHLELLHPLTGESLSFDAPLPEDLARLTAVLREDCRLHDGL